MPYDEFIRLPDGTAAFVRFGGRRPRAKPCACCGGASSIQCDFPLLHGGTCDAYLCRHCAVPVGRNRDHCPQHQRNSAA
jgi:hypothetical protein